MDRSQELETVKCAIRAVLQTFKNGMSVKKLLSDYRELNGTVIPYKNFGFTTLERFLSSLRDTVKIDTRNGETLVTYVETVETAHIEKLVKGQRGTKKKPSRVKAPKPIGFRRQTSQPYSRPTGPARRATTAPRLMTAVNNSPLPQWPSAAEPYRSAVSNSQLPNWPSAQPARPTSNSNNNNSQLPNWPSAEPARSAASNSQLPDWPSAEPARPAPTFNSPTTPKPPSQVQNGQPCLTPAKQSTFAAQPSPTYITRTVANKSPNVQQQSPNKAPAYSVQSSQTRSALTTRPPSQPDMNTASATPPKARTAVQTSSGPLVTRQWMKNTPDYNALGNTANPTERTVIFENQGDVSRPTKTSLKPNLRITKSANAADSGSDVSVTYPAGSRPITPMRSFKLLLEDLVSEAGLEPPRYRAALFEDKKTKKMHYLATVSIDNEESVLSYPTLCPTPDAAEEEAARKAFEAVRKRRSSRSSSNPSTPVAEATDKIVTNILKIFSDDPKMSSLFDHGVPDEYQKKFNEPLPSNWMDLISKDERIEVERRDLGRKVLVTIAPKSNAKPRKSISSPPPEISAAFASSPPPAPPSSCGSTNSVLENAGLMDETQQIPDSLVLPGTETWDVIVTKVISANEVIMRLVDYADQYVDFVDEMHSYYAGNPRPVQSLCAGKLYAARLEQATFRVHLQGVDPDDENYAFCMYVDEGGQERLHKDQLNELAPDFLKLPFQAFACQLAELKHFQDNELGKKYLDSLVSEIEDSVVVAVPTTREDPITVRLYDTSSPEDRDLNEELLCYLKSRYYLNILKSGSTATVYISFVSDGGDFFVQMDDKFYQLLNENSDTSVAKVCTHKISKVPTLELAKDLIGRRYTCYGLYQGAWYRAQILSVKEPDTAELFYLDYGNTDECALSEIRVVDDSLDPLHSVPYLAVRCRLDNVPSSEGLKWSSKATDKWYEIVGENIERPFNMKVIHSSTDGCAPKIELFDTINSEPVVLNMKLASFEDVFEKQEIKKTVVKSESISLVAKPKVAPYENGVNNGSQGSTSNGSSRQSSLTSDLDLGKDSAHNDSQGPPSSPAVGHNSNGVSSDESSSRPNVVLGEDNIVGSSEAIPEPVLPPVCRQPSCKEDYFDLLVTLAATPHNFTVQAYYSSDQGCPLDHLMDELFNFYEVEENRIELHPDLIKEGQFVCAKWNDESWYRVRVEAVVSRNPMLVMCYFVDYGDLHGIELKKLQPLFSQFRKLPMQAMKASLANVVPAASDWDVMACYEFANMVENKPFVSTVYDISNKDNKPVLQLILCDTSQDDDVYIDNILIQKSFAMRAPNFT